MTMENEEKKEKVMFNILSDLPFYKGKSALRVKTSFGVKYGVVSPYIEFKFAPRADAHAQGEWDDRNVFWLTNYIDICTLCNELDMLVQGKLAEKKVERKNPAKKTAMIISLTENKETEIEYANFTFYRDGAKVVSVPLLKNTEFFALHSYFKNIVNTYNLIAQGVLTRSDIWFRNNYLTFTEGGKKSAPSTSNTNTKYSANQKQSFQKPSTSSKNMARELEDEIANMSNDMSDNPF